MWIRVYSEFQYAWTERIQSFVCCFFVLKSSRNSSRLYFECACVCMSFKFHWYTFGVIFTSINSIVFVCVQRTDSRWFDWKHWVYIIPLHCANFRELRFVYSKWNEYHEINQLLLISSLKIRRKKWTKN